MEWMNAGGAGDSPIIPNQMCCLGQHWIALHVLVDSIVSPGKVVHNAGKTHGMLWISMDQ